MSTEVTPESPDLLRRVANAWTGDTASDDSTRRQLRARADHLERGKTPGQTLWEADRSHCATWRTADPEARVYSERMATAVLAAHGTPTLTPVGEHPEPGTRGLMPVVLDDDEWGSGELGMFLCLAGSTASRAILADPRPDGAHE